MSFNKIRTIKVSERVFDIVCETLDIEASQNYVKIDGWLECFNNCREQGYVLFVSSTDWDNPNRTKEHLYIWACECRNSDDIMVVVSNKYPCNGMFDEEAYDNRNYFRYNQYYEAADYILNVVKDVFEEEFKDRD